MCVFFLYLVCNDALLRLLALHEVDLYTSYNWVAEDFFIVNGEIKLMVPIRRLNPYEDRRVLISFDYQCLVNIIKLLNWCLLVVNLSFVPFLSLMEILNSQKNPHLRVKGKHLFLRTHLLFLSIEVRVDNLIKCIINMPFLDVG